MGVDRGGVVDVTDNPEGTALIASFSPAGDLLGDIYLAIFKLG